MTPTQDYLDMPDDRAANLISCRIKDWDDEEPLRYAALGLMMLAVHKRLLWKHVLDPADGFPCRSFARWVRVHAPNGYSTCYAALRDVEELQDVPAADLAQIPQSNFRTLKQLSTKVRGDEKVLAIAKSQRTDALVAYVKDKHPDQHLERDAMFRCPLSETQMHEVEAALAKAMVRGCASRSEALWMLAVDFLQTDDSPLQSEPDQKWGHA